MMIKTEGMINPHLLSQPHPDDCQVICAILFDPWDLQLPKAPPPTPPSLPRIKTSVFKHLHRAQQP